MIKILNRNCLILLLMYFTSFTKVKAQKNLFTIDKIILCLNEKIETYNFGIEELKEIKKSDTLVFYSDTLRNIKFRSFEATDSYNKLNLKFKINYYYSDDPKTILMVEKQLLEVHRETISQLDKEFIVRVENLVICISVSKQFDGSFLYLKNIMFQLIIDYLNQCKQ